MKFSLNILITLLLFSLVKHAGAVETDVMIRAKAVDAKYIGSSVGGIKVIVEDAESGEVLDTGWIKGGTGNTQKLVVDPVQRGEQLSDESTAGYLAKLDISSPRFLRIKLIGPYGFRQALQEASITTWLIPGKHILGDGITLTMPGIIVDSWSQVLVNGKVTIYSKATLLCGCPIIPDGLWDPDNYEATAIIMQDEYKIDEIALDFTGPIGIFSGETTLSQNGHYKAIVYIFDKDTGNLGVDRTMFEISDR